MFLLKNLNAVDEVVLFGSDQELESLFEEYKPDIMVKGSDYAGVDYIGQKFCKSTVYYDRIEPYSSTAIIQSIANRR
jgi:bifunctional ADP-heptose synthase (sugar kinase/adenylyltransferase)